MDIKLILENQLMILLMLSRHHDDGMYPPGLEDQIKHTRERIKNWGQRPA